MLVHNQQIRNTRIVLLLSYLHIQQNQYGVCMKAKRPPKTHSQRLYNGYNRLTKTITIRYKLTTKGATTLKLSTLTTSKAQRETHLFLTFSRQDCFCLRYRCKGDEVIDRVVFLVLQTVMLLQVVVTGSLCGKPT